MAGGFFTNMAVAGAVITILTICAAVFLTNLQTEYGLTTEVKVSDMDSAASANQRQITQMGSSYNNAQSGSSINQQVTDTAQVQSIIDAEKQKTGFLAMVQNTWESLNKYLPFDSRIVTVVVSVLAILGASAVFALWRQRWG